MAKSRVEKNKKLYEALDEEMKNNKGNIYEEKLKSIDPNLEKEIDINNNVETVKIINKKSDVKNDSALTVIAKEINGKNVKKNEVVPVNREETKKTVEEKEDVFEDPISFTDKLSVEEILRVKIEQQEKIKTSKKDTKKSPNDSIYTPEMMQERIKLHEGVDVRKEANVYTKDYKWFALSLLVISLIAVIALGVLLIFKVIEI